MARPRRAVGKPARYRRGLRPGLVFSALLHLGLAALAVVASLRREKPPEPLPPPSYEVRFDGGAPERPAEAEITPPSSDVVTAPVEPEPLAGFPEPPGPDLAVGPPEEAAPPPPLDAARTAETEPPTPPDAPQTTETEPPTPQDAPRTAEAEPPTPQDAPRTAEAEPPSTEAEAAPALPPPPPPRPQREAALTAPPRPARPPPSQPLPGLFLPEARRMQPAPQLSPGPRRGLDLSPGQVARPGRESPEPQFSLRGANVGPDWYSALRRWWIDNRRAPPNVDLISEGGSPTVEMALAPDGRVTSVRLIRPSGSVWLDAGAIRQFRGAVLPALPPGTDPSGATLTFTINYILIR